MLSVGQVVSRSLQVAGDAYQGTKLFSGCFQNIPTFSLTDQLILGISSQISEKKLNV